MRESGSEIKREREYPRSAVCLLLLLSNGVLLLLLLLLLLLPLLVFNQLIAAAAAAAAHSLSLTRLARSLTHSHSKK